MTIPTQKPVLVSTFSFALPGRSTPWRHSAHRLWRLNTDRGIVGLASFQGCVVRTCNVKKDMTVKVIPLKGGWAFSIHGSCNVGRYSPSISHTKSARVECLDWQNHQKLFPSNSPCCHSHRVPFCFSASRLRSRDHHPHHLLPAVDTAPASTGTSWFEASFGRPGTTVAANWDLATSHWIYGYIYIYGGVHTWGYQKWLVYQRKMPVKWMMTRGTPISGNHHMSIHYVYVAAAILGCSPHLGSRLWPQPDVNQPCSPFLVT